MRLLPLLLSTAAFAAPLVITEPGDFPSAAGASIGNLDIGFNTIDGAVNGASTSLGDARDGFTITLPAGMTLVSVELFVTGYSDGGGISNSLTGSINATTIGGNGQFAVGFVNAPGDLSFVVSTPWSEDENGRPTPGGMTYQLQLSVEAEQQQGVPEPAPFAIVAGGLAALFYRKK